MKNHVGRYADGPESEINWIGVGLHSKRHREHVQLSATYTANAAVHGDLRLSKLRNLNFRSCQLKVKRR